MKFQTATMTSHKKIEKSGKRASDFWLLKSLMKEYVKVYFVLKTFKILWNMLQCF